MNETAWTSLLLCSITLVLACNRGAPSQGTKPESAPEPANPETANAALARLDPRTPVPLTPMMAWHQKQNMMEHLEAIAGVVQGLAQEDWSRVETSAAKIQSSPQMEQMCNHMGAGAEGFTALALSFHRGADGIVRSAREQDAAATLAATAATLQLCTGCHSHYRQEVVTEQVWLERTGGREAPHGHHGP